MKKWNAPEITELNINETAHEWLGNTKDGGYIGDGEVSGHLEWNCNGSDDDKNTNSPS